MTSLPDAKSIPSLRAAVLVCVAALTLIWLIVATWVNQVRALALEATGRELLSLSVLLADNTDRTLQGVDLLLLAGHHILFQIAISEADFIFEHEVFLFNRTYFENACFSQNAHLLAHQPTHWNWSALMGEIRETTLLGNNRATMQVEKVRALMKIKFQKLNSMGTASR